MTDIVVNIYYLSEASDPQFKNYKALARVGLGLYHSGIELNGVEYSYGGNVNNPGSGVFQTAPLTIQNATYFQSYNMGTVSDTKWLYEQLRTVSERFRANEYSLIN